MPSTPDELIFDPELETELKTGRPEYHTFLRFAHLEHEKRRLKDIQDQIQKELTSLQPQLKEYMGSEGYQRVRVAGFTIYLRRTLYVRPQPGVNQQTICAALKRNNLGHFVVEKYLQSNLSDHVRDLEELNKGKLDSGEMRSIGEALPEEVAALLILEPNYSVVAMQSA